MRSSDSLFPFCSWCLWGIWSGLRVIQQPSSECSHTALSHPVFPTLERDGFTVLLQVNTWEHVKTLNSQSHPQIRMLPSTRRGRLVYTFKFEKHLYKANLYNESSKYQLPAGLWRWIASACVSRRQLFLKNK